jgi:hypothetical protein
MDAKALTDLFAGYIAAHMDGRKLGDARFDQITSPHGLAEFLVVLLGEHFPGLLVEHHGSDDKRLDRV